MGTHLVGGKSGERGGFTFDRGVYRFVDSKTGATIELSLHLGHDTSFGKKGDLVTFDLFEIDTYVKDVSVDADISVDWSGVDASVDVDGPGPGFELLGLTSSTGKLLVDPSRVAAALGALEVRGVIKGSDDHLGVTLDYELAWEGLSIDAVSNGTPPNWRARVLRGTKAATKQTMTLTDFDVTTRSGGLQGSAVFLVQSPASFDYRVTFSFAGTTEPKVTLACSR